MIKAILFDLDGTLVDSLVDLAASVNFALRQFGFPGHELEEFRFFVGDGIFKMIERALPADRRDCATLESVAHLFLEHYSVHFADNTLPYAEMPEAVDRLRQEGLKLAVVTNKAQEMADKVVAGTYGDTFDIVFGKREGIPAKPDPTAALTVMEMLGVKPCECIFVGDSGNDVLTGFNSGALPVGVLWGYRDRTELLENHAAHTVKSPRELAGLCLSVMRSSVC